MARNYQQGVYEVKNREKYVGTKDPRYLSSFEKHTWAWCDRSPNVLKWGAEIIVVPYYNPVKKRNARYIVDFYMKYKNRHGEIKEALVEIKPKSQCRKPVRGRKKESTYLEECMTYAVNQAKWEAATKYALERGWEFRVITEESIFKG